MAGREQVNTEFNRNIYCKFAKIKHFFVLFQVEPFIRV